MTIQTNDLNKVSFLNKREFSKHYKKYHEADIFQKDLLMSNDYKFTLKVLSSFDGNSYVLLSDEEIYGNLPIYIEFINLDNEAVDSYRNIYKWIPKNNYKEIYASAIIDKKRVYLVPLSELENFNEKNNQLYEVLQPIISYTDSLEVSNYSKVKPIIENENEKVIEETKEKDDFEIPEDNIDIDVPFDSMTLKDFAAIVWKKPISGKSWLNEIIKNNFK